MKYSQDTSKKHHPKRRRMDPIEVACPFSPACSAKRNGEHNASPPGTVCMGRAYNGITSATNSLDPFGIRLNQEPHKERNYLTWDPDEERSHQQRFSILMQYQFLIRAYGSSRARINHYGEKVSKLKTA